MMAGLLITSIGSGQLISRLGRYKPFPIAGTAIMVVSLVLLSRLQVGTSTLVSGLYMLVLGLGLGMVLQVLVLAAQNSVDYKHLGVATSGSTLFRQIGGSIGVALFGAIFSNRLAANLSAKLPPGAHVPSSPNPRRHQAPPAPGSRRVRDGDHTGSAAGLPRRRGSGRIRLHAHVAATRDPAANDDRGARCGRWFPRRTGRQCPAGD